MYVEVLSSPRLRLIIAGWWAVVSLYAFVTGVSLVLGVLSGLAAVLGVVAYLLQSHDRRRSGHCST